MNKYDQLTRDLARKAGDDAVASIYRTMALHDEAASKSMIATMAAGQALGVASIALMAKLQSEGNDIDATHAEKVVDALWTFIRPIAISTVEKVADQ